MIPSATTVSFFHHGSVHDKSSVLVVLVNDMALGLPIHWVIFIVVGVIGLGPLINLLDGPPLSVWFLSLGLLFGFKYFGNPFGRQCLLAEGFLLSSLPFIFLSILVWTFHLIVEFGSSRVRVPRQSPCWEPP